MRQVSLVVLALAMLGSASIILAQAKEISEDDFYRLERNSNQSMSGVSRREKTEKEEFSKGTLVKRIDTVEEYSSNGNRRVTTTTLKEKSKNVVESVWVGFVEYRREKAGSWTMKDWSKGPFSGLGSAPGYQDENSFTFEEKKDGPISTKILTRVTAYNRKDGKTIITQRIYMNTFGWKQKVERTESENTHENVVIRSVTLVDYPEGKIEIEAPIK